MFEFLSLTHPSEYSSTSSSDNVRPFLFNDILFSVIINVPLVKPLREDFYPACFLCLANFGTRFGFSDFCFLVFCFFFFLFADRSKQQTTLQRQRRHRLIPKVALVGLCRRRRRWLFFFLADGGTLIDFINSPRVS